MKSFQIAALLGIALTASGCVSIPPDATAFRRDATAVTTFRADVPLRAAFELIVANTVRCHEGDANQMSTVSGMHFSFPVGSKRIEGNIDEATGRADVAVRFDNLTHHGMLQVIDLVREGEAQTRIDVHQLNDTKKWQTASASVEGWFGGETGCYEM
jgi:hypothetical protein